MSDGILDAIDGTLRDCTVSLDAMRWQPEEARALASARPALAPAFSVGGPGGPWYPLGSLADGTMRLEGGTLRSGDGPSPAAVDGLAEFLRDFCRALGDWARAVWDSLKRGVTGTAARIHGLHLALRPRDHRRCVTCHPSRKPKPLAVDGHAYQRRLAARRKRRRR